MKKCDISNPARISIKGEIKCCGIQNSPFINPKKECNNGYA